MLRDIFQSMRARRLLRATPQLLVKQFSSLPSYTPAQVDWALKKSLGKLPNHRYLAYALFCDKRDFMQITGESSHTWDSCRRQLGRALFAGRTDFTVREVLHLAEQEAEFESSH
ncbi:DUF6559 family protein [Gallaecimonas pentaromativorans]|uniref:Uncharacterized protein n=1 Tax=Gallaecimonas pentaromativorans TaxID=584787 RepID=A0A3N1PFP8_9GAMM|nr:DUF6559 family protein [Gallaecimonas pentaromativorans]MED5526882.1 DUF6559 family protein [Pseudomonadota bacterium]ROQ23346.1 hypothetical protein EDC28_10884 [Gallaecimonas pentaromativorans]